MFSFHGGGGVRDYTDVASAVKGFAPARDGMKVVIFESKARDADILTTLVSLPQPAAIDLVTERVLEESSVAIANGKRFLEDGTDKVIEESTLAIARGKRLLEDEELRTFHARRSKSGRRNKRVKE
jgi:hypothetical protein